MPATTPTTTSSLLPGPLTNTSVITINTSDHVIVNLSEHDLRPETVRKFKNYLDAEERAGRPVILDRLMDDPTVNVIETLFHINGYNSTGDRSEWRTHQALI